jgi:hypothetical protein
MKALSLATRKEIAMILRVNWWAVKAQSQNGHRN